MHTPGNGLAADATAMTVMQHASPARRAPVSAVPEGAESAAGTRASAERRLRAIFDDASVGLCYASLDGRFLQVNDKLCEIGGYTREELLRLNYRDITAPEDIATSEANRIRLLSGPDAPAVMRERRYIRKDGAAAWISIAVSLVRDDSGQPDCFLAVVQDINERKAAEAHFRATFEQAAVGIAHMAPDGRYLRANQKLCDLLGYAREELLARTAKDLSHPDDYEAGLARRRRLLTGEAPEICAEKRYIRKDGSVVYANRSASLVRGPSGEPAYILAVVTDITAQKLAEQVLRESEQRFRAVFDQPEVGISMRSAFSRNQRWTHVNDAFCRMLGYTREELLQLSTADVTPPEEQGRAELDNDRLRRGEITSYSREKRLRCKDGRPIWVQFAVTALTDEHGHPKNVIGIYQDITDRKRAAQALDEAESRLREITEHIREVFFLTDPTCARNVLYVSPAYEQIWGRSVKSLYDNPASWTDLIHPDDRDRAAAHVQRGAATGTLDHEYRIVREDGTMRWIRERGFPIHDDNGRLVRIAGIAEDITAFKAATHALLESDEKFRQLAEHIPQVFWMTDVEQKAVIYVSPAYERITGRSLAELQADPFSWQAAIHEEDRERVRRARRQSAPCGTYDLEYRIVHTNGSVRWIHDRAFPVRDARGGIYRIAGIGEDITERRQAEEQLVQLAHYDTLTGLPNRALFQDRLQQSLTQAQRNGSSVGVMLFDLDRFKLVNDTLGHASGDRLLRLVAERLQQCLRSGDTAGRLSGDEFAVLLSPLADPQDASLVAQRILKSLARPFDIDGSETFISASIGITLYPSDGADTATLMRNADAAMYAAKNLGRNNHQFYTAAMNERAREKMQLEVRLRRAMEQEEFVLQYQPKVAVASGEITGLEALLRWQPPENGMVPPDVFIPLLEETGLIVPVGEWVLRAACAQVRSWLQAGLAPVPVAVNVSARQLQHRDFCDAIRRALDESGIEPRLIEMEITESSLMEDPEAAIATLKRIRDLGIRLSVDDFGTGYSSLGYLKRLPLDTLKIDRSFVRDTTTDPDDAAITRTVTALAHSLGLKVVAEGVETEEQLTFLGGIRCDEAQGFLFSRPRAAEDCTALLSAGRRLYRPGGTDGSPDSPAVLIVDDDPDQLLLTLRLLQKDGHRILTASDTGEAFDLLATHRVGVVVADQKMPGMTGASFLGRVKRMYPGTTRIMLSGFGDFQTAEAAINIGEVHKFYLKGRDEELMRGEVHRALRNDPAGTLVLRPKSPRAGRAAH